MDFVTLLLLGGAIALAQGEVREFEQAAAQDIAARLTGEHKSVRIQSKVGPEALFGDVHSVSIRASRFSTEALPLLTESDRSKRGLLRTLHIDLGDFNLGNLHVQSLSATIPDSRFDFSLAVRKKQIRLTKSGTGPGTVVLAEDDLAAFILKKFREVKDVKVRLSQDKVFVDGRGAFVLFDADFSVVAKLEPLDGRQLVLLVCQDPVGWETGEPRRERCHFESA